MAIPGSSAAHVSVFPRLISAIVLAFLVSYRCACYHAVRGLCLDTLRSLCLSALLLLNAADLERSAHRARVLIGQAQATYIMILQCEGLDSLFMKVGMGNIRIMPLCGLFIFIQCKNRFDLYKSIPVVLNSLNVLYFLIHFPVRFVQV